MDRRLVLQSLAAGFAGVASVATTAPSAHASALEVDPWSKMPGGPFRAYGMPAKQELARVTRVFNLTRPGTRGSGGSRTPLELLEGIITPNGLHFERSHSGTPDIDPDKHNLVIHGMVARPLKFSMEALLRYPMRSRIMFMECAGNSRAAYMKEPKLENGLLAGEKTWAPEQPNDPPFVEPAELTAGAVHGLVSCADWAGIPLAVLLEEAGVDPKATWIIAEGADAASHSRSIPLAKAMDDTLVALYQNGERLRPEQGYPVRLILPGYEGNMAVKWLRRIEVTRAPVMSKGDTEYSELQKDGRSQLFTYVMHVKSLILRPSPRVPLSGPGLYEISGLAWSGLGKVRSVKVSADGGATWAEAALDGPVLSQAFTRFRIPWKWNGGPAVLMSQATDETGAVQPTRAEFIEEHGRNGTFHNRAVQSWAVDGAGRVTNVGG